VAAVIYISKSTNPPGNEGWVLVERTPSGKYVANGSSHGGANSYRPTPEDRQAAISNAIAWADDHGVPAVYVRGSEDDA
jgi:hypothetical protein